MANATFYLMDEQAGDKVDETLDVACDVAARFYRQRKWVWVFCQDQKQAELFDQKLWERPVDSFIAHNLVGEGPAKGAPVEIGWEPPSTINRPILINLSDSFPQFADRFQQVIDFVPVLEEEKQKARDRYKQYRIAGFQMQTQAANTALNA